MDMEIAEIKSGLPLEQEFQYYLENQVELSKLYYGKSLIIKDQKVVGAYDSHHLAYEAATKEYPIGTFLIQLCLPGTQAYTSTYHSLII